MNENLYYDNIMKEIDNLQKKYDYIYVSTIIQPIYNLLSKKYNNKILFNNDINRLSSTNNDWMSLSIDLKQIYKESYIDAFFLSKCDFILGGSSNLFLAALIFNPNIPYKIFDAVKNINGL
jgi:hypothetical protein